MYGQYQVVERIAVGGMAEIYRGIARGVEGFERPVVIKRVHPRFSKDQRFVKMLVKEAQITARLNHPNIVQILDLGESEDGEYFIVMEFVEGRDLRAVMDRAARQKVPLGLDTILYLASEVCDALEHAHRLTDNQGRRLNLIHRDVSPSNILISFAGEVKLTDFGVARYGRDVSVVGSLKGKLAYMSPEQARAHRIDHRSDIFSLGAVLFELLLGRRVFLAQTDLEMLHAVRHAKVSRPSEIDPSVPHELERVLLRALAPRAEDRYQSMDELGTALRTFRFSHCSARVGSAELATLLTRLFDEPQRRRKTSAIRFAINTIAGVHADGEPQGDVPRSKIQPYLEDRTNPGAPPQALLRRLQRSNQDMGPTAPHEPVLRIPRGARQGQGGAQGQAKGGGDAPQERALLELITGMPELPLDDWAQDDGADTCESSAVIGAASSSLPGFVTDSMPAVPVEDVAGAADDPFDTNEDLHEGRARQRRDTEAAVAPAVGQHTDPERPIERLGVRAAFAGLGPVLGKRVGERKAAAHAVGDTPTPIVELDRQPLADADEEDEVETHVMQPQAAGALRDALKAAAQAAGRPAAAGARDADLRPELREGAGIDAASTVAQRPTARRQSNAAGSAAAPGPSTVPLPQLGVSASSRPARAQPSRKSQAQGGSARPASMPGTGHADGPGEPQQQPDTAEGAKPLWDVGALIDNSEPRRRLQAGEDAAAAGPLAQQLEPARPAASLDAAAFAAGVLGAGSGAAPVMQQVAGSVSGHAPALDLPVEAVPRPLLAVESDPDLRPVNTQSIPRKRSSGWAIVAVAAVGLMIGTGGAYLLVASNTSQPAAADADMQLAGRLALPDAMAPGRERGRADESAGEPSASATTGTGEDAGRSGAGAATERKSTAGDAGPAPTPVAGDIARERARQRELQRERERQRQRQEQREKERALARERARQREQQRERELQQQRERERRRERERERRAVLAAQREKAAQRERRDVPVPRREPVARAGRGQVVIKSEPWAYIYVDGKRTKRTTSARPFQLPAGLHRIELVNPALNLRKSLTLRVEADGLVRRFVKLSD